MGSNKHRQIAIAVCYFYQQKEYLNNDFCIPIQVGHAETQVDFGIQRDDVETNVGYKHSLYSEYSGIYWMWKNINADYKGMMHHRRFFTLENVGIKACAKRRIKFLANDILNLFKRHACSFSNQIHCNEHEYEEKVKDFIEYGLQQLTNEGFDAIVPMPYHYNHTTVGEEFDEVITRHILRLVRSSIAELFPEYRSYFEITWNSNKLYYGNIEIMKSLLFDEYCHFVFTLFEQIETLLVEQGLFIDPFKEKYLDRVFGYLGELLTNSFILKLKAEGKKIKEVAVLFNDTVKGYT